MRVIPVHLKEFVDLLALPNDGVDFRGSISGFHWLLLTAAEYRETRLVIGDVGPHETLFIFWRLQDERPGEPRQRWAELKAKNEELRARWRDQVIGGGTISVGREAVPTWTTNWFKKDTPEEWQVLLRATLAEAIRVHFSNDPEITLS